MSSIDENRVYNGGPDSTLRKKLAREQALLDSYKSRFAECSVTYFPMEAQFMGFHRHKSITGFCDSRVAAWRAVEGAMDE